MEQKLASILWDVMILAGFIYLGLIMWGKVKPANPIKTIQQPSFLVKVLIYTGLFVFIAKIVLDIMGK